MAKIGKIIFFSFLLSVFLGCQVTKAEDGYRLWLRYDKIENATLLKEYRSEINGIIIQQDSPTIEAAKSEIVKGLKGLLDTSMPVRSSISGEHSSIIVGTPKGSELIASLNLDKKLADINDEGFLIEERKINGNNHIVIAANSDIGVLYGVFNFLRQLQTNKDIRGISIKSEPKIKHRILDHWDNLDRTVERGYAGLSLWQWSKLPEYKAPRYTDYARANASIGINGAVLNNVNADPRILTKQFIKKAAALADVFRPYGIKVYFSANFYAPMRIGGLKTADPLNPKVREWWKQKVDQIYKYIPNFGGFLVKANSEGQPGPADYNRTHAQGANVMAEALKPHGGIVMWRAFVYNAGGEDRAKEAYDEFVPLDGKFDDNVILQVKNGPIDFQPREPFHPLFGALKKTNTMMELQVTQEYFGFSNHLTYLGPLYQEVLDSDTYAKGKGSTVAKVIEGKVYDYNQTGIAGVANTGNDRNWTNHPFAQANWFVFGRMAWNPTLSSENIADDWIRMTFTNNEKFIKPVKAMMMKSREAGVKYREPLGLAHLCIQGQHYGPAPWTVDMPRRDWTAVYYHRADSVGIGFDRTKTGSNAVEQYHEPVQSEFRNLKSTPDKLLLWFHHVPWDYKMNSGRTLWQQLVHEYYEGVDMVRNMQKTWNSVEGLIDQERYQHVKSLLKIQEHDAVWWRNACVLYFQTFSKRPIPDQYEKPSHTLEYYKKLEHTKYYEHN